MTVIRSEIECYMMEQGMNITTLSRLSGLNVGTVSSVLKGHKLIAVDQLDRITSVMGLPQGHYYSRYIQESMVDTPPNWRRIRPLLYRCVELNLLDCIRQIVNLLLDNLMYSTLLFETAEDLYQMQQEEAASILYEGVAQSELRQHSERLAVCQYRLFTLKLSEDQARNLEAAIQFEPYVERLDEIEQLDALRDLANIYRSLRRWDKVEVVARTMGEKASIIYNLPRNPELKRREHPKRAIRPLFFYIAYANLLLSNAYDEKEDYGNAMYFIGLYGDMSWVKETDEETLHWRSLFLEWAEANSYVCRLAMGDESVVPSYIKYIQTKDQELLPGLINIVQNANKNGFDISVYLDDLDGTLQQMISPSPNHDMGVYTQQMSNSRFSHLFYELAVYYITRGDRSRGRQYIEVWKKYTMLNNEQSLLRYHTLLDMLTSGIDNDTPGAH